MARYVIMLLQVLDFPTFVLSSKIGQKCYRGSPFSNKIFDSIQNIPLSAKRNVPDAVKDFICTFGAPAAFLSNSAAENKSGAIKDLEHHYNISSHHYSRPGYQNQD